MSTIMKQFLRAVRLWSADGCRRYHFATLNSRYQTLRHFDNWLLQRKCCLDICPMQGWVLHTRLHEIVTSVGSSTTTNCANWVRPLSLSPLRIYQHSTSLAETSSTCNTTHTTERPNRPQMNRSSADHIRIPRRRQSLRVDCMRTLPLLLTHNYASAVPHLI